ncbi:MAG: efflux RND transporter periplasmic adaptor subunit [Sphingomonadaceae bacterium]
MTRRILGVAALAAGILALVWALAFRDRGPAERYETAEVVRGRLTETVSANGTLNPVRVVNVGSQVSGTVEKLYVDFNDRVTAGQVLLELDPRLFRARLQQSEAALANARAQAALAEANARRAAELFRQDFISRQDYDQAMTTARSQAAQVASAAAAVSQDRANLGFSIIRAPVSGVVISRKIDIGQTVAASFQTPELFTIAQDLTEMQIEAAVAEADISRVRLGQPVSFTVDAFGDRPFEGAVSQIRLNPATQQNVVTYTVVVAVPNPDGALLPGMTVNATFVVKDHADALLVPNAALSWKPADWTRPRASPADRKDLPTTLFVLGADGRPAARRVALGAADNERSIVLRGDLKPGDRVITGTVDPKAKGGAQVRVGPGGRG